jgi:hypothetical protein
MNRAINKRVGDVPGPARDPGRRLPVLLYAAVPTRLASFQT